MNTTYIIIIIAAAVVFVILAVILGPMFAGRRRSERFQKQYGAEYDRTVETAGSEKKAQSQLNDRRKHVATLKIRPLSASERDRYAREWTTVQSKFVDEPGQATVEADHLIMEVMQLRDYPLSDFEHRAADVSIQYPELVSNYRAARDVAILNEQHHAGTEDLRQAMIHYRSLFDELLKADAVGPDQKTS